LSYTRARFGPIPATLRSGFDPADDLAKKATVVRKRRSPARSTTRQLDILVEEAGFEPA
jgi:hypothetical protein